jgi:hypothetical protein
MAVRVLISSNQSLLNITQITCIESSQIHVVSYQKVLFDHLTAAKILSLNPDSSKVGEPDLTALLSSGLFLGRNLIRWARMGESADSPEEAGDPEC